MKNRSITTTPGTTYISGIEEESGKVIAWESGWGGGYSWSVFGGDMAIDKGYARGKLQTHRWDGGLFKVMGPVFGRRVFRDEYRLS